MAVEKVVSGIGGFGVNFARSTHLIEAAASVDLRDSSRKWLRFYWQNSSRSIVKPQTIKTLSAASATATHRRGTHLAVGDDGISDQMIRGFQMMLL